MFRTNFHPVYLALNYWENCLVVFTICRRMWSILALAHTLSVHVYQTTWIFTFLASTLKAITHLSRSKPDVVNKLVWVRCWAIEVGHFLAFCGKHYDVWDKIRLPALKDIELLQVLLELCRLNRSSEPLVLLVDHDDDGNCDLPDNGTYRAAHVKRWQRIFHSFFSDHFPHNLIKKFIIILTSIQCY